MDEDKKISAVIIFEALGKPQEHLVEFLKDIVKRLGEEKGVKVIRENTGEPILAKGQKELYTSFLELDLEFDRIGILTAILFKYMPAHVDISYPEKLIMSHGDWNEVSNEILRRLHAYDEMVRVMQIERAVLENKLKDVLSKTKKD